MKSLTLALVAASLACAGFASAQDHMSGKGHTDHMKHMSAAQKSEMDMMMRVCMTGLSEDEKKTAMAFTMKMTPAEHAVMLKRCSMCMKDSHKDMMSKKMDKKAEMAHVMSGLSASEQKTMKGMMAKMSAKDAAVTKKIIMNCCMYGMKHAKK